MKPPLAERRAALARRIARAKEIFRESPPGIMQAAALDLLGELRIAEQMLAREQPDLREAP